MKADALELSSEHLNSVNPDVVESEYLNVAEVWFVGFAGSELTVIDGGEAANAATTPNTSAAHSPSTPSSARTLRGLELHAVFLNCLAIRFVSVSLCS